MQVQTREVEAANDTESVGLERWRRIFVNRTLRFDHSRLVGFDMDYTLLPYRKTSMEALSFELTVKKLVENYGYTQALYDLPYDPRFVVRGLVVDKKHGNIIKLDQYNHVGRVYHGRRMLSKEERRKLYRTAKIRLDSPRYHWIDTLFALPEAALYADIIDLFEKRLDRKRIDYRALFTDIRSAIDECHRDDSLKAVIKADFDRFVEVDPDLPMCLHKLRSSGKRVFLLTNSFWDYTNAAMTHLLNGRLAEYPTWQNYFDFIIVGASKPAFFTEDRPFLEVNKKTGEVSTERAERFERQHVYQGGCIADFDKFVHAHGDEILYVGDHIYGDIIRSKKDTLWRNALVLTELEDELQAAKGVANAQADLLDLEERRFLLEHEVTQHRLRIAAIEHALDDGPDRDEAENDELMKQRRDLRLSNDRLRKKLKKVLSKRQELSDAVDAAYNPFWGSVFKEGAGNSAFGRQVELYACIYTSRVSNLLFYSPAQYFRAPRHWMAHEKH